jgi:hypothetical protein
VCHLSFALAGLTSRDLPADGRILLDKVPCSWKLTLTRPTNTPLTVELKRFLSCVTEIYINVWRYCEKLHEVTGLINTNK